MGGRDAAIIGGALGAAAGVSMASRPVARVGYDRPRYVVERPYYVAAPRYVEPAPVYWAPPRPGPGYWGPPGRGWGHHHHDHWD